MKTIMLTSTKKKEESILYIYSVNRGLNKENESGIMTEIDCHNYTHKMADREGQKT